MATQSAHTWSKPVITDRGLVLRQKAIDNTLDLKFTKAQVGTGKPSNPNNIGKMTALVTPQKLARVMRSFADDQGMFTQTVRVENTGYQSSIPVTEIGVFATIVGTGEEVLYSYIYCLSGAVAIPPESEHYYSHDIQLNTGVSLTDNVTLVYDGTGVFVDHDELDEHNKSPHSHPNKVDGVWTIFNSLEEIGITSGKETIQSVISAMPDYSFLKHRVISPSINALIYPTYQGYISYEKYDKTKCSITYCDPTGSNVWKASYVETQNKFDGWIKQANRYDMELKANAKDAQLTGTPTVNGKPILLDKPIVWRELTLVNGFKSFFPSQVPKFSVVAGGILVLTGTIKHNANKFPTVVTFATLPNDINIKDQLYKLVSVSSNGGGGYARLHINPQRQIIVDYTNNNTSLNNNVNIDSVWGLV